MALFGSWTEHHLERILRQLRLDAAAQDAAGTKHGSIRADKLGARAVDTCEALQSLPVRNRRALEDPGGPRFLVRRAHLRPTTASAASRCFQVGAAWRYLQSLSKRQLRKGRRTASLQM
jgi:hypothetical protein